MKAARLTELGTNLTIKTTPDQAVHADGVRGDVESAQVATFTKGNLAGEGAFEPSPPLTPGPSAVGVVNAVGEGVSGVDVSDRVFCDPRVVSWTKGTPSIGMLTGWSATHRTPMASSTRGATGPTPNRRVTRPSA